MFTHLSERAGDCGEVGMGGGGGGGAGVLPLRHPWSQRCKGITDKQPKIKRTSSDYCQFPVEQSNYFLFTTSAGQQ